MLKVGAFFGLLRTLEATVAPRYAEDVMQAMTSPADLQTLNS